MINNNDFVAASHDVHRSSLRSVAANTEFAQSLLRDAEMSLGPMEFNGSRLVMKMNVDVNGLTHALSRLDYSTKILNDSINHIDEVRDELIDILRKMR